MLKHARSYILLGICLLLAAGWYVWLQIPTWGGAIDIYAKKVMADPQEYALPGNPETAYNYNVYNLKQTETGGFECTLMLYLKQNPDEQQPSTLPAALQKLRIEKQGMLWQAQPLTDFQKINLHIILTPSMLPNKIYTAEYGDFQITIYQQVECVPVAVSKNSFQYQPKNSFNISCSSQAAVTYTGSDDDKEQYQVIGISAAPMEPGQARPQLEHPGASDRTASSNNGSFQCSQTINQKNMENTLLLGGSGINITNEPFYEPAAYALNFYINGKLAAELTLLPVSDPAS